MFVCVGFVWCSSYFLCAVVLCCLARPPARQVQPPSPCVCVCCCVCCCVCLCLFVCLVCLCLGFPVTQDTTSMLPARAHHHGGRCRETKRKRERVPWARVTSIDAGSCVSFFFFVFCVVFFSFIFLLPFVFIINILFYLIFYVEAPPPSLRAAARPLAKVGRHRRDLFCFVLCCFV